MDENIARQYDYKANSNLVLPNDKSLIDKRPSNEATGEIQSLAGRLKGRMGDRASSRHPQSGEKSEEDADKSRKRKRRDLRKIKAGGGPTKLKLDDPRNYSVADIETKDLLYQPKSEQTAAVYGLLIKFVRKKLGFQHSSIITGAADEVIRTMKDPNLDTEIRRSEASQLLSSEQYLDDEEYNELCNLCKRIDDYDTNLDPSKDTASAEESGDVNLVLSDDELSDEYLSEVRDSDDEFDLDDMFEKAEGDALQLKDAALLADMDVAAKNQVLNPRDIDAYWLQRNLKARGIFDKSDTEASMKKDEILNLLETARDDRDLENKLMKTIGRKHFDFIKLLQQNRRTILFCTKLAKATGHELSKIRNSMKHDKELSRVLALLDGADKNESAIQSTELAAFAPMDIDSEYQTLNLESLSKKVTAIASKVEIVEPERKEGYHEYHILPKKRTSHQNDHLIRISDLPERERRAFGDLSTLNPVQSRIYKRAISTDHSLLICAPTGAGKTNIAILTMLREIFKHQSDDGFDTSKFKIIYIAPMKALVQEIVGNFAKRLGIPPYNLRVDELTGDHQLDQKRISDTQVLVCTPEKWDIVTRKSLDRLYTKLVRLVIFDEIHLLHNDRGATLEALVARIKRHKYLEGDAIRIVGLSATLPNYRDVARFIAPEESEETSTFYFDSSYRPIPLRQQYVAMTESKKAFRMINDIVYEKVIERLVDNAQILVFVHSRPDTVKTADYIKTKALDEQKMGLLLTSDSSVEMVNEASKNLSGKLKELIQFGLGVHHAGMSKADRSCVEDLFRGRFIRVLVSTATLAWGVNLPARTVIVKGTQVYRDGNWTDLDSLDLTQMLGRAGRPGYDREGEGIVITQQSQVQFYMSLMNELLPVESKLIGRLPEFINAECVVGNIESLEDAVRWLSETYLSSRMESVLHQSDNRQHLTMYGIDIDAEKTDPSLVRHKYNLAYTAARTLDQRGLVNFDRVSGAMRATELGRIASHYNCSSKTIKLFYDSIHENTSDIELLRAFSLADEFKDVFVRKGEETDWLTLINQVPYPINDKRATPGANKVNALLQVYIFRMNIEGSDLICDMHFIKDNAARLTRAIHEIALMKKFAQVAELSFDLCRKVDRRMTVCHSPLRQFADDLHPDTIGRLEKKNFNLDELKKLKGDGLATLLRCDRQEAEKLRKLLSYLPKLHIEASVKPVSKSSLRIDLYIVPDFKWNEGYHGRSERFWLLVEDVNQEILLHHEELFVKDYTEEIKTNFQVPYLIPAQPFYYLRIFPDSWFGCDHHLPIHLEKLAVPDEIAVVTQPVDLEALNFRSIQNPVFEQVYEKKFSDADFNQIQTQSFNSLLHQSNDVVLLAAAGSGKTVCAELSMIREFNRLGKHALVGYVAANAQAAQLAYENWSRSIGEHYRVMALTGNHRQDAQQVDQGDYNIVVGDRERWHILTLVRSKKHRKLMSKFNLIIFDDIHLLHNDPNSTLEWLCSKIRILSKADAKNADPTRIIALGSPMSGAQSVKEWLTFEKGLKEPVLLNFPPSIRPVKMDLRVMPFHHHDYKMRLATMQRPLYRLITQTASERPTLVFVSDFNRAEEISETLIYYARSEGRRLIHPRDGLDRIRDTQIRDFVHKGVGFVYRGMDDSDMKIITNYFSLGQLQVLVATVASCWSLECRPYLTVVMDTQHFNGLEQTDYELVDIMQMVGLAGRPMEDFDCRSVVMCHQSRADYYECSLREPLASESQLPDNLVGHVNYEVAIRSLTEMNNIYNPYLAHTFFYKRITINPNYYGVIVEDNPEQKARAYTTFFSDLAEKVTLDLEKSEFINLEGGNDNPQLLAGLLSKISLEYYINQETIVNYLNWLSGDTKLSDVKAFELIELLSTNTVEFQFIPVRHGETQALRNLSKRYLGSRGGKLHLTSSKIKLLLLSQYQKTDGKEDSVEGELIEDRRFIIDWSYKLLMAIVDIAWLKDSLSLAKNCIQLAKKISPFLRSTQPNIDMDVTDIKNDAGMIKIDIELRREDDPFSFKEFSKNYGHLPVSMYRDEGWFYMIHARSKTERDAEKFALFKRVKAPRSGLNKYYLEFSLADDASAFIYDLYLMSDFYSTRQDRKAPDIEMQRSR